jgi:class 3 adenylate cyclase
MTYMAATGIKACESQMDEYVLYKEQTERLLNMAMEMVEKTKGIMYGKNKDKELEIKIGIHTGKAIAGVIGYHKPQFSLIGDTVNTTSRHCSKANPKEVVLSEEAYKKVSAKIKYYTMDHVRMKGLNNDQPVPIYRLSQEPPPIIKILEKFKQGVQNYMRIRRDEGGSKRNVVNPE